MKAGKRISIWAAQEALIRRWRCADTPKVLDLYSRNGPRDLWELEFFSWPNKTVFEVENGRLMVCDVAIGGHGTDWLIASGQAGAPHAIRIPASGQAGLG